MEDHRHASDAHLNTPGKRNTQRGHVTVLAMDLGQPGGNTGAPGVALPAPGPGADPLGCSGLPKAAARAASTDGTISTEYAEPRADHGLENFGNSL